VKEKILIQIPVGLKHKVLEFASKAKGTPIIWCENCWGACDIPQDQARNLGCGRIVHYGHTQFTKTDIPVEYIEYRIPTDPIPVLEKNWEKLASFRRFGLVTSLQFLDTLEPVKKYLESKGKCVVISKERKGDHHLYPGQLLGCDASVALEIADSVDCFLHIGSGKFHPLAVSLKQAKPVLMVDLERRELVDLTAITMLLTKQRYAAIAIAKDAKTWGILITTKLGQSSVGLAEQLKEKLEKAGRTAHLLAMDEITPDKLLGIPLDAYVSTACPRLAVEDRTQYKKPFLNPDELSEMLNSLPAGKS
jgi:2-(3-amino-3-carboxypropyl)histidine synthase